MLLQQWRNSVLLVLRDKMSMATQCVLQLLQEGDVTGISSS